MGEVLADLFGFGNSNQMPTPDYTGAARAQGAANVETARTSAKLSNPNYINPMGSRSVSYGGNYFDQAGFDKARQDYASGLNKWNAAGGANQQMYTNQYDGNGDIIGTMMMNDKYVAKPTDVNEASFRSSDPDRVTVTDQLTPLGQQRFDQEQRIIGQLGGMAEKGLSRVGDSVSTPFSFSAPSQVSGLSQGNFRNGPNAITGEGPVAMPSMRNGIFDRSGGGLPKQIPDSLSGSPQAPGLSQFRQAGGVPQYTSNTDRAPNAGPIQNTVGSGGDIQRGIDYSGNVQSSFANVGGPQRGLDYSGAPKLPGTDDFSADRQRVEQAIYSRLEPQLNRDKEALRTQLVNQGFRQGTEAYDNAMDQANRQATDARMQAVVAGGNEQSRLFGMGLQSRQQAVGETADQGTFANQAQQQSYGQEMGRGNFANQAEQTRFQQAAMRGEFGNQAQQQAFAQGLAGGAFQNQAQQQGYQQGLAGAGLNLAAEQQAYGQAMGNRNLGLSTEQQAFQQRLSSDQAANQAEQARLAQQLTAGNFQNQARQQSMQEAAYLRGVPLNELNALRSGAQVSMPQFQQFQGTQVAPTPIFNAAQAAGQAQMGAYNAQQAQNAATMQGMAMLGGAALGAPTGTFPAMGKFFGFGA